MPKPFAIVDLFSGPGGISEGFASFRDPSGRVPFSIEISVEKDLAAHATLKLRSFLRKFGNDFPTEYYDFLNGRRDEPDWALLYPNEWAAAENLALEFEHIHGVTMSIGATLEEPCFEKWLDNAQAKIDPYFWGRYRDFLEKKNFSGQVLATLNSVTNRTLGLLENPNKTGRWNRRGMVIGHVQSGKTANYIGLVCKAADAGYKVIIVIAGIHNRLRSQTQSRIDEGFTGVDSSKLLTKQRMIGVGCHNRSRRPSFFTNTLKDFNKQMATTIGIPLKNLKEPTVFVIKKNTKTLKNLVDWLRNHNAMLRTESIKEPMLLIDDEADNASINIMRGQEEISRINGQIRQLLNVFDRSCYVGYTATPFANIFIDPDSDDKMFGGDLFPKDFIVSLDPPDNYFGASRVFSSDPEEDGGSSIVRHIEDNEDLLPLKHKINHPITDLPNSLKNAVRAFIVGRAIRLIRKHDDAHNSMLVNVSRFVSVQQRVRNEIDNFIARIHGNIRVNGSISSNQAVHDPEISLLKRVFDDEYQKTGVSWDEVQNRLLDSVSPICVMEVNSKSGHPLDYSGSGRNIIAVGGFALSRGLTLEGLMISYFLRNSMMYDTLMQMGRWFGYRLGYDDLCRIWMLEEAEGWYTHISESIEELRDELRNMEVVNATPRAFGLKVRCHPDTLFVTAKNKMGSSKIVKVSVGLANRLVETTILRRNENYREANHRAAINLAKNLKLAGHTPENMEAMGGKLVDQVAASHVIDFLTNFQNHRDSWITQIDPIRKHIEERMETELSKWDIFFPGVQKDNEKSLVDNSLGFRLVCQRRNAGKQSDKDTLFVSGKQRVASRGAEAVGLSKEEKAQAEADYQKKPHSTPTQNYPDRIYRLLRKRPLLMVHLLAIGKKGDDLSDTKPIVAWSISFPKTDHKEEKKVEYIVNTTWIRGGYEEAIDEDTAINDDD